jgi:hypothetical protein
VALDHVPLDEGDMAKNERCRRDACGPREEHSQIKTTTVVRVVL